MNEQEQRIAIAKACGLKVTEVIYHRSESREYISEVGEPIPDYLNDLNEIMKPVRDIMDGPNEDLKYRLMQTLCDVMGPECSHSCWQPNAAQWSKTLIKTLNLWEESE
jgi:hypothetical protein